MSEEIRKRIEERYPTEEAEKLALQYGTWRSRQGRRWHDAESIKARLWSEQDYFEEFKRSRAKNKKGEQSCENSPGSSNGLTNIQIPF